MLKSIALAAVIAVSGGGAAFAQNQTGAALVDAIFAQAEQEILNGSAAAGRARGVAEDGGSADHVFNLQAGKSYLVIGVCDESCSDLDLALFGVSGEDLGSDYELDDAPMVMFQASRSGQYRVNAMMASCDAALCHYGVRIYEQ